MTPPLVRRDLPHPPGRVPLLGDITHVDRYRPIQNEMALAASLGPIFERRALGLHFTYVTGARLAAQCSDEQHWERALYGPVLEFQRFMPDSLFVVDNDNPLWGQARRIFTPAFAQKAMRSYHQAMQSVADDLVAEWSAGDGVIDTHSAMTRAAGEVIGRAGFSRELGLFRDAPDSADSHAFIDSLSDLLRMASDAGLALPVVGPIRRRLLAARVRRNSAALHRFSDRIITERQAHPTDDEDLLNLMLTATDPETGHRLPLDNVREQVLTFMAGGYETTAALLESVLHYIAADQKLQEQIRTEISERGGFDYKAVTGMRLIRHVLNECLRLWPPAPGYFRRARTDQDLGGYRIPAGHMVFVIALAAHRDKDVWGADADAFDPYRFEPDRLRSHPDRFFEPWGTGPRSCIGRQFALHEATLLVARILSAFELSTDGTPLAMRERGTLRPEPYQLKVVPRADR
ncbi:cytochrome P450 [Nocardia sp. NPDC005746]|uniref:cytochrome P450 n=1 Tax=Nocardia sp. NPDC005746 TaxID=3157062 RepID=UPI00340933D6